MTEIHQDKIAIQRFVEYIQVKTVQPKPDYEGAMKSLKTYAQELDLAYRTIPIVDELEAVVLTVE